jgi:CTP synthase
MNPKIIFFTGGVVSSVGKGVTAAAVGLLLKERGFKVMVQKLDPYLNVDPGTMSPYQHGEVYVLDDGAETDLDLGHYERFMDIHLTRTCNITTGQVYAEVISKERKGNYLGGTIQVIPHITNEIKHRILQVAEITGTEIILVEVGGTVGDIESQPYLEALRQLRKDLGKGNTLSIHVTWLPYISSTSELKTKPTQHSVRELRSLGIQPDMIVARSDQPIDEGLVEKIALFCDVEKKAVVPMVTNSILYEIPLKLEQFGVAQFILKKLALKPRAKPDWKPWRKLVHDIQKPKPTLRIALVGKYVELHDAYLSVREALFHAAIRNEVDLKIEWIHSENLDHAIDSGVFSGIHGIIIPGGFGSRGIEGMIHAAAYARTNELPYLGLCLGMQIMSIDFARMILNSEDVNSSEFEPGTANPVIDLMSDQQKITDKGGTMRLGLYPCNLKSGSIAARAYGERQVEERHRHRFEFNNKYVPAFESHGMVFSGLSPDGRLVEIIELGGHPFMLGTQFHPEFLSRPNQPHPLFTAFLAAAKTHAGLE